MFDVRRGFHNFVCASLMISVLVGLKLVHAHASTTGLPKFEDYLVSEVFNRTPHSQFSPHPEERVFRTRIREGVEKGWCVWVNGEWTNGQNRPGPNFAGHYIVIVWGCGSGCIRMAMSDAETGAVYNPPISEGAFALPMLIFPNSAGRAADVQYRKDSRLMIVTATPRANRRGAIPCAFYFLWQGDHWTLLRSVPIEE